MFNPFRILIAVVMVSMVSACVNHPAYWSEESCEYCIKQNEHYIRIHKDEMVKSRLRKLEKAVEEIQKRIESKINIS